MPLHAPKRRRKVGTRSSIGTNDCFLVRIEAGCSFRPFFDNEELSDCIVEASGCRSFKCHKVVLAATSPVFQAMFRSSMTEATTSEVQIHGVSPQVVELLLRLVYGKSATVPVQSALALYMLADQYQCSKIASEIADATAHKLTSDALCSILPEAHSKLGSTAKFVRKLVNRAADIMPELPVCQHFHSWGLALVQQVMQADYSDQCYARFLAAAEWVQGAHDSRQQYWPGVLLPLIEFEGFTNANFKDIRKHHPELLQLEGVSEALFKACCNRLPPDYLYSTHDNLYGSYSVSVSDDYRSNGSGDEAVESSDEDAGHGKEDEEEVDDD